MFQKSVQVSFPPFTHVVYSFKAEVPFHHSNYIQLVYPQV